ncbi:MAG TPA: hypothetical protein DC042_05295, partial [Bacteroidales bacterium]|nr:hypothetical protein [Bacteroidales bacterium]
MKRLIALIGLLTLLVSAPASALNPPASESLSVTPILWLVPNHGNFGAAQLGQTASLNYILRNSGSSVLNIKKIEVVGECFSLTDTTHYPFEIIGPDGVAFSTGNSGKSISFKVKFTPTDVQVYTGKLRITYDLYFDLVHEVTLIGEGLSCYKANEAHIGENWAPKQNSWFKFTSEKFGIYEINSCHPDQPNTINTPRYYIYAYSDCQGTLLPDGEDLYPWCPNDRYADRMTTVLEKDETIYLFWPLGLHPDHPDAKKGFFFNIVATYP